MVLYRVRSLFVHYTTTIVLHLLCLHNHPCSFTSFLGLPEILSRMAAHAIVGRTRETELVEPASLPSKRPTHNAVEIDDYDAVVREVDASPVDDMGSVEPDRKDMKRMGKSQEMRVCIQTLLTYKASYHADI